MKKYFFSPKTIHRIHFFFHQIFARFSEDDCALITASIWSRSSILFLDVVVQEQNFPMASLFLFLSLDYPREKSARSIKAVFTLSSVERTRCPSTCHGNQLEATGWVHSRLPLVQLAYIRRLR